MPHMSIASLSWAQRTISNVIARLDDWIKLQQKNSVTRLLADTRPPELADCASRFAELQHKYPRRAEYGYDTLSTWSRGVARAQHLLSLGALNVPGSQILEVACGDAMAS